MRKRIGCLMTAVLLMFGSVMTAQAEDYTGGEDLEVNFTGDKMESSFTPSDLSEQAKKLQPGDSVTFQVELKNSANKNTDWYMTNEVIKSLEDNGSASGGAYTYVLTYAKNEAREAPTILYSSENVGGEKTAVAGVGLREATSSLKDFFYLDTLEAGKTGTISMKIALDGETQGNAYQGTEALMQMNFAVEKAAAPSTTTKKKEETTRHVTQKNVVYMTGAVQTGDANDPLLWSGLTFASGIMLMLLGFVRYRKGGRGYEEAE